MFGSSFRIARVWGIPIKIHMSLILLMLFYALQEWRQAGVPGIVLLLIIEGGIILSIVLHELGHSFVALHKGCRVREITLMFIGGAAQMEEIPARPADEFQMAVAGPLVSLLLGVGGLYGGRDLYHHGWVVTGVILADLGYVNLFLAAFNLLPSFPMDGGRVLRALLARKLGRLRATAIAARLGKLMAMAFGLYGFLAGLYGYIRSPRQWILVAIAFFIYSAASREYAAVQMQEAYRQHGGMPPNATPPPSGDADVVIGPPPYDEDGRRTRTRIRTDEERG